MACARKLPFTNETFMKLCNPFSEQEEEVLRVELEKKYALFARQEKKGEEPTIMERTRANIKNLQTRKHVASRAVDAAVVNIQRLRDEELYPQLLELLLA
jgi:hypothetical protein